MSFWNECEKCKEKTFAPFQQGWRCIRNECGFTEFARCVDCGESLGKMTGLRCPSCRAKRSKKVREQWRESRPPKPKRIYAQSADLKEIGQAVQEYLRSSRVTT